MVQSQLATVKDKIRMLKSPQLLFFFYLRSLESESKSYLPSLLISHFEQCGEIC